MIPQSLLNQYREDVERAGVDASNYMKAIVETYRLEFPNASVSEIRDYTRDAMRDCLYLYGGQSALLSNELFEEIARQNGEELSTDIYETIDYNQVNNKIRYFAKSLVTGDIADFDHSISDLTKYYIKREAFQNMVRNCDKHGLRYARVPSGRETCAFCFMLASRGFVYWSEEEAGGLGHKYHSHCDCVIVPGFNKNSGVNEDEQIEGYKPSKLYKRYQMCYDTINPNGTWDAVYKRWRDSDTDDTWEQFKTKALVKEINTRDVQWLWSGKLPKITYETEELKKEIEEKRPHEKRTAQRLRVKGIATDFRVDQENNYDGEGNNRGHADFFNGYELKTLQGATSKNTLNSYLKDVSKRKADAVAVVFDNTENVTSDSELIDKLKKCRAFSRGRIYVLTKEGRYLLIR